MPVLGDDQGIHLEQAHVLLDERLVQERKQGTHLLLQAGVEAERPRHPPHVMRADVRRRIDRDGDDLLRRVVRHPLDVHAAAIAIKGKLKKEDFDATVALHPTMAEELVLMR